MQTLKENLLKILRGEFIKLVLKKILGQAAAGGFKAWLVKLLVKEFYDEIGEPIIRLGLNTVGYKYDRYEGKVFVKRLTTDNEEAYDDTLNDIFRR